MKKVLSILLTVIFLTGIVGVSLTTHFCGGMEYKKDIVFGSSDLSCGMENDSESPCEQHKPNPHKKCCKDSHTQLMIQGEFSTPAIVKTASDFKFLVAFLDTYINLYYYEDITEDKHLAYSSPPLLKLDIHVLFQTFLI